MQRLGWTLCVVLLWSWAAGAQDKSPIILGLHADMSAGAALGCEAIRRGALLAISEINAQGGLLGGRKLELMVRDHHGVPARAGAQLPEFADTPNLVAILGGVHGSAVLPSLRYIHQQQLIFISTWAVAAELLDHGMKPNYVFRVAASDPRVSEFLISRILNKGHTRVGLLLERTAWGRSNEKSLSQALARRKLAPVGIQWVNWTDKDMEAQIDALQSAGAQAIIMVANAPEASNIVKTMARRPEGKRLPLYSHVGIAGGNAAQTVGPSLTQVELYVFQTFSFIGAKDARTQAFIQAYHQMFGTKRVEDIVAPVGTAHAYDAVWLLALAIKKAGTTDRAKVRDALEHLAPHKGLIRTYKPAFTPSRHDALEPSDYRLATFTSEGVLVPSQP